MDTKYCPQCDKHISRAAFYKDQGRPDGLQGRCKACSKDNARHYYYLNADKTNARKREKYRAAHTTTQPQPQHA